MFAKYFGIALYVFIAICGTKTYAEFPDDPKPCKHGDAECVGKIINYLVREKAEGDPKIGLNSLDPIDVKKFRISRSDDSPVRIDLLLTNSKVLGLKTAKFKSMKGLGKEIAGKHEIVASADHIYVLSDYNVTGQILILPVRGQGRSNLTLSNLDITFGWTGVPEVRDGNTYMKVDKFYIDLEPKGMTFGFENLFNDKALSDNMNKFLGENWVEVYGELRGSMSRGLAIVTRKLVKDVFAKFPYDKLFTD